MKFLIPLLCLLATEAFSQDYLIIGDTLWGGQVRRYGDKKLVWEKGDNTFEYPMDQVIEYQQRYTVYRALWVDGQKSIYKRIVDGKSILYQRGHRFILKAQGKMVELNRKDFRTTLAANLAYEEKDKSMSNVIFSRMSLQSVVQASNAGACNFDRFAYRKFGLTAGYSFINLKASSTQWLHSTSTSQSLTLGAFYEGPVFSKFPWLYASAEALYVTPYRAQFEFYEQFRNTHIATRLSSVVVTPGLKFVTTKGFARPYVKFAPAISYTHFNAPEGLIDDKTGKSIGAVHTDRYLQIGFSSTAGVQFKVGPRTNVHLEARHMNALTNSETEYGVSWKANVVSLGLSL